MTRRIFYSFHYKLDSWRTGQVRNIGFVEGNQPASDNDWESVKKGGDAAIKRWIADQMSGRSCTIVLVGAQTAGRKWINYEIKKSWENGMGVAGIYIHGLKDENKRKSEKGANPFGNLQSIVNCYNPPVFDSKQIYSWIHRSLPNIIEEAIDIRNQHRNR